MLSQVGGAVVALETRAQLDAVVAHQASTAAAAVQKQSRSGAPASAAPGALHLAALRALLASVLAPCRHAPPFLPHALHLFSQVPQPPGAALALHCSSLRRLSCRLLVVLIYLSKMSHICLHDIDG